MSETTTAPDVAALREQLLEYAGQRMSHASDRAFLSTGETNKMVLRAMRELCPDLPWRGQDSEYTEAGIAARAQAAELVAGITGDEVQAAYRAYLAALPEA